MGCKALSRTSISPISRPRENWRRRDRKKVNIQRRERGTVKHSLLDVVWPVHSGSPCICSYKTWTKIGWSPFIMDPEHANEASVFPKRLLAVNNFWKRGFIFFQVNFPDSRTPCPCSHKQPQWRSIDYIYRRSLKKKKAWIG